MRVMAINSIHHCLTTSTNTHAPRIISRCGELCSTTNKTTPNLPRHVTTHLPQNDDPFYWHPPHPQLRSPTTQNNSQYDDRRQKYHYSDQNDDYESGVRQNIMWRARVIGVWHFLCRCGKSWKQTNIHT